MIYYFIINDFFNLENFYNNVLIETFIPITKDLPTEAKIKSHQLMLRAGMIKQSSAGIYSCYL